MKIFVWISLIISIAMAIFFSGDSYFSYCLKDGYLFNGYDMWPTIGCSFQTAGIVFGLSLVVFSLILLLKKDKTRFGKITINIIKLLFLLSIIYPIFTLIRIELSFYI